MIQSAMFTCRGICRENWLIDVQMKWNRGFRAEPTANLLSVDMVVESKVGFKSDVAVRKCLQVKLDLEKLQPMSVRMK